MRTGENEQGLRKILDFTRLLSIAILIIHFYLSCYVAFKELGFSSEITDKIILIISNIKIFELAVLSKSAAFGLLLISLIGAKGRKDEKTDAKAWLICGILAIALFFGSVLCFRLDLNLKALVSLYIATCSVGYILVLTSGTRLSRLIKFNLMGDIFNRDNETFPQEERKLDNPYSINLPARYYFKGKFRDSWINIINPFRGLLVLGTPGSGKSYFAIRHIITQHIRKGFSMFIYDFKYDDLTRIAYNTLLNDKNPASFYVINFEDLSHTHRCNPLDPNGMTDITDATEAARTIMLGLNREWIKKQGDFFVESPINFLTAIIWYLRKYKDGAFCTLPHVIELMQVEYQYLFAVLNREPEIEVLINPFISAWKNEAFDQLEGQVASAKISMAKLSSPSLYYVLSGNDFSLDLNNPDDPKVICVGNNPQKQQVYGAVLSLYISRMIKLVNQKDKQKCSLIFDEFPTIYFNNMDSLIATARSNQVATSLAVQDYSQLKKDYGREQAEVILNIVGNVISGQVTGDTAKHLSERFGKIQQQHEKIDHWSKSFFVQNGMEQVFYASTPKRPLSVDKIIPHLKANKHEKVALLCLDCMGFTEWNLLKAHLELDESTWDEKAVFAMLPSVTSISRMAIYEGKREVYNHKTPGRTAEAKALANNFAPQHTTYLTESDTITADKLLGYDVVSILYNFFDELAHAVQFPPGVEDKTPYLNAAKEYLKKSSIKQDIQLLKEEGYAVYLCSDHGSIVAKGNGKRIEKYLIDGFAKRAVIIQADNSELLDMEQINIPFENDKKVVLPEGRTMFTYKDKTEVNHGGITLEEMIVPFIKLN